MVGFLEKEEEIQIIGEADNGKEAITKTKLLQPDLVILDISLQDLNGLIVAKKILNQNPYVKILVLTMYESEEYLREFLKIGVNGYVVKRAADNELIGAIHTVSNGNIFVHSTMAKSLKEEQQKVLSPREKEVLILLAKGYVNKEISRTLHISIKTVETYRARVMQKLNLTSRSKLTEYALKTGLLTL